MSEPVANNIRNDRESHLRSLLKAISYRITGTITTALLVLALTGDLSIALTIGAVEPAIKLLIYYLHERAWQCIPRGTVRRYWRRLRKR
ncbi:DUF2061 domain-containing protein [Woeseia oceani]|uniref:DUF2061 domain-containing protein n=1 Tax=Woeseia oceani TaxID=1548547 RepID=A0A193LJG5_9GAMM|nr:DUF2061 domain-containing protein [Woeseia oceani]ANO52539.1 hypothetical protein BA177_16325 [Woeseia oceani]